MWNNKYVNAYLWFRIWNRFLPFCYLLTFFHLSNLISVRPINKYPLRRKLISSPNHDSLNPEIVYKPTDEVLSSSMKLNPTAEGRFFNVRVEETWTSVVFSDISILHLKTLTSTSTLVTLTSVSTVYERLSFFDNQLYVGGLPQCPN